MKKLFLKNKVPTSFSLLAIILTFIFSVYVYNLCLRARQGIWNIFFQTVPAPTLKTYESSLMNFNVEIPSSYNSYKVEEGRGVIKLKGKRASIFIRSSRSSFNNIKDYLSDLDQKNKIEVYKEVYTKINDYDAVIRVLNANGRLGGGDREYVLFVDNWVYTISVSSLEFWGDLNKVAYSFEYTPILTATKKFKSYTSLELKVSFEYPRNWFINDRFHDLIIASYDTEISGVSIPSDNQLLVFIREFSQCYSTIEKDLIDNSCGELDLKFKRTIVSKESWEMDGGTFLKYVVIDSEINGGGSHTYYLLQNGDRIISFELQPTLDKYEKEFEEIINSIRFL